MQTENVSYRIDIEVQWGLQHKEVDVSDGKIQMKIAPLIHKFKSVAEISQTKYDLPTSWTNLCFRSETLIK